MADEKTSVKDVGKALSDSAEARTENPDLPKGEVVDARLDNRTGADRPVRQSFPAVPQQVDGPDLAHQAEFTRRYLDEVGKAAKDGDYAGAQSLGPHGLSSPKDEVGARGKDRADESGGDSGKDGAVGAPHPAKAHAEARKNGR